MSILWMEIYKTGWRCPNCSIFMDKEDYSLHQIGEPPHIWVTYRCRECGIIRKIRYVDDWMKKEVRISLRK